MRKLADFPVTTRWPAQHPDRLQLYSIATPNGVKVSIMLEEIGLEYEAHRLEFRRQDTQSPEFRALNPNAKIPAILDPNGPGGQPIALFESAAILIYLADKSQKLLASEPSLRYESLQWLFFQMASVGPNFGQFGYFHRFDGKAIEDPRPLERFRSESQRLLSVLEQRLQERDFMMGSQYSVVDISLIGWVHALTGVYDARSELELDACSAVMAWRDRCLERPAVQRGLQVPGPVA